MHLFRSDNGLLRNSIKLMHLRWHLEGVVVCVKVCFGGKKLKQSSFWGENDGKWSALTKIIAQREQNIINKGGVIITGVPRTGLERKIKFWNKCHVNMPSRESYSPVNNTRLWQTHYVPPSFFFRRLIGKVKPRGFRLSRRTFHAWRRPKSRP